VVDVWSRRRPSTGSWPAAWADVRQVGGMPQPDVTPFQVYNTFHHGQWA
jgi:hypothetical protein